MNSTIGFTFEELCAVSSPPEDVPGDSLFFWDWKRFDFAEYYFDQKRREFLDYLKRFTKSPLVMMPDHMSMKIYSKHLGQLQKIQRQLVSGPVRDRHSPLKPMKTVEPRLGVKTPGTDI